MAVLETDYLIVGGGASGMAFADSLFDESDATMIIVDRQQGPGGHWNNAYPFVRLHQPSSTYGVNSLKLGHDAKEGPGLNEGLYERATGAELLSYYEQVLQRMVRSGRVRFLPMQDYVAGSDGRYLVKSLVSGEQQEIKVRKKLVDTTYFKVAVPSTHPPKYAVAAGVSCVPLNALPRISRPHSGYVVVGAGKTGVDACLWLLENGAHPDSVTWIMPRDSWFTNRAKIQVANDFFVETFTGFAQQMESIASAASEKDLFDRLEAAGVLMRIDTKVVPTMYHAALMSEGEVTALRRIRNVIRLGRVVRIEASQMVLERGSVPTDPDCLYVDCSASAFRTMPLLTTFDKDRINVQTMRWPAPTLSAALIAFLEVHGGSDEDRNFLTPPVPLPDRAIDWLHTALHNLKVQQLWNKNDLIREWILRSRLDGYAALGQSVDPADTEKVALRQRYGKAVGPALANVANLLAQS